MTAATTISLTLTQLSLIIIFIIGQTITVARFIYVLMKKDTANETSNKDNRLFIETSVRELIMKYDAEIKSTRSEYSNQYNQLEIAFQNNCKSCSKKHNDIEERFKESERQSKEAYTKFTETLDKLNQTMVHIDKSFGEHVAFHKGIEEANRVKHKDNG